MFGRPEGLGFVARPYMPCEECLYSTDGVGPRGERSSQKAPQESSPKTASDVEDFWDGANVRGMCLAHPTWSKMASHRKSTKQLNLLSHSDSRHQNQHQPL